MLASKKPSMMKLEPIRDLESLSVQCSVPLPMCFVIFTQADGLCKETVCVFGYLDLPFWGVIWIMIFTMGCYLLV
jgi:hypothetical protein